MLNPFPILWLAMLAHAILRFVAGSLLIWLGCSKLVNPKRKAFVHALWGSPLGGIFVGLFVLIEIVAGSMLIVGFLTQFAAIATAPLSLVFLVFSHRLKGLIPSPFFYILLFAVSLSLLITGAGAFAYDLPI